MSSILLGSPFPSGPRGGAGGAAKCGGRVRLSLTARRCLAVVNKCSELGRSCCPTPGKGSGVGGRTGWSRGPPCSLCSPVRSGEAAARSRSGAPRGSSRWDPRRQRLHRNPKLCWMGRSGVIYPTGRVARVGVPDTPMWPQPCL